MQHFRGTIKHYRKTLKQTECPFCNPQTLKNMTDEFAHSYILPNITKYDHWEGHDVAEHLMIIPKRHVPHLKDLTRDERSEIIDIIADYESQGYNIYARGLGSPRRSVAHQHTHLIRIRGNKAKFMLYMQRPYLLLMK